MQQAITTKYCTKTKFIFVFLSLSLYFSSSLALLESLFDFNSCFVALCAFVVVVVFGVD